MNDPEALVRSISPLSLNILNNVEEGVVVIDSCGKIVFMNQAATVLTGWREDDAKGSAFDALLPALCTIVGKDEKNLLLQIFSRGKTDNVDASAIFPERSESVGRMVGKVVPLYHENGEISCAAVIFRTPKNVDSSEWNNSVNTLFELSPEPVFLVDRHGTILLFNDAFEERFGKQHEQILGLPIYNLISPEVAGLQRKKMEEVLRTGQQCSIEEEWEGRTVRHTIYPLSSKDGAINQLLIFLSDITSASLTENKLLKHKMHYRNLFNNRSHGYACCRMIFQGDRPVDYIYEIVNPAFEKMIGHQGIEGRKMTEVIPGLRHSNPEFFERLGRVVESGIAGRFEFYIHELDKWFDISAHSEHKGELVLVLSPVQTMTTGIWEWNPDNGKMIWSDELRLLFGLGAHSCEAAYEVWLQFVAPGERELAKQTIENAVAKSVKFNIVCHVNSADGSSRRLMIQGFPARNADGSVNRYMGISIDITEYKKEDITHRINTGDLDAILKSSTEPFCSLALDGTVLDANKDFYEILDIESNNLKGHNFYTLFSCELQQHRKANFELVYYTGEPVHFQDKCSKTHCNANYSGECIYQISVYPVYGESVKIESLAVFIVKSNERNKSEKAQRKLDQKYQTLIAASPDSIITTDLQGNITSISDMGLDLYGTNDRAELIGMPFSILVHSDDIKILNKILEIALYDGLIQNREILLKKKNNMIYSAEISAALIQDFNGAPSSYMIIIRDISQRKIIESELFHAKRLISLGEMASGIAHEIYQPINNIGLIVDNLLMDADKYNWDSKKAIKIKSEKIFENILRVQTIIDNIRSFSSTDKNYISSVVNINQSIRNALLMVSEQCKNKSITLDFKPRQDNLSVTGNMYKFEQVILNLIKNSIDALEEIKQDNAKSLEMKILVQSYYEKDSIIVTVEDNGIGISQENIEYIMHPFYTTKDSGKGTGLGLSISYRIIKEMNGDIKIKSRPMNGTCVIITLPNKGNKNE